MADEDNHQFAHGSDPDMERAKAWWNEHGRAIVAGIAIGLSAVVGFNFWQNYKQTQSETASVLFEELRSAIYSADEDEGEDESAGETEAESETESEATAEAEADTDTESDRAISALADQIMADYAATPYATHAAFALAKHAVESGDLGEAERVLRWALDNGDDANLRHVARLRLVSVLLAGEDADAALVLLNVPVQAGFAARYSELLGDAFLLKNDPTSARSAYERSAELLPPRSTERALLQLKLDDLGS